MKAAQSITIHAPLQKVFLAAADLTRWPEFLPHYRHNRFFSQTPSGGVVEMSCWHAGIPVIWVSEFRIDARGRELRFTHLRSTLGAIAGTETVWTFTKETDGGVDVTVTHHPAGGWLVVAPHKALGRFLLPRITGKTLAGLKRKLEAQQHTEKSRLSGSSRPARKPRAAKSPASPKPVSRKRATKAKPARKRKQA